MAGEGGYSLVTNKYWVFFDCGPREWTGRDVRGGPQHTMHAWKVPGDLLDVATGSVVEKVLPGVASRFHPGRGKEKLKSVFRGWSQEEHGFYLKDHQFLRGIFAETQGEWPPQTSASLCQTIDAASALSGVECREWTGKLLLCGSAYTAFADPGGLPWLWSSGTQQCTSPGRT